MLDVVLLPSAKPCTATSASEDALGPIIGDSCNHWVRFPGLLGSVNDFIIRLAVSDDV
jgi:hypothetical protein